MSSIKSSDKDDFDFDDEDLDDLLGLNSDDEATKKKNAPAKKGLTSTTATALSTSPIQAKKSSISASSGGILDAAASTLGGGGTGIGGGMGSTLRSNIHADPMDLKRMSAPPTSFAATSSSGTSKILGKKGQERDVNDILKSLGDMDEMDEGLFGAGLTKKSTTKPVDLSTIGTSNSGIPAISSAQSSNIKASSSIFNSDALATDSAKPAAASLFSNNFEFDSPASRARTGRRGGENSGISSIDGSLSSNILGSHTTANLSTPSLPWMSSNTSHTVLAPKDNRSPSAVPAIDKPTKTTQDVPTTRSSTSQSPPKKQVNDEWSNDDLFDSMGLGDSSKPVSKLSLGKPESSSYSLSMGTSPKRAASPSGSLGRAASPSPVAVNRFETSNKSLGSSAAQSPSKAKEDAEEFVPSFLMDNPGGRRRRGPPPGSQASLAPNVSGGFGLVGGSRESIQSNSGNEYKTLNNGYGKPTLSSSKSSVVTESKPAAQPNLPFLDAKPKFTTPKSEQEKETDTKKTESKPTSAAKSKTEVSQKKDDPTESSILSSIASLSPTDTSEEDEESQASADTEKPTSRRSSKPHSRKTSGSSVKFKSSKSRSRSASPASKKTSASATSFKSVAEKNLKSKLETMTKEIEELQAKLQTEIQIKEEAEKRNKELVTGLEAEKMEVERCKTALVDAELKLKEVKAALLEQSSNDKAKFEQELDSLKRKHSAELEEAVEKQKAMAQEMVDVEIAKLKAAHETTIAELKAAHLDEMHKTISTTDAARKLQELAERMDKSSRFVDSMQHKLESDYLYTYQERENVIQSKEKQSSEIQRELLRLQRELDEEKIKIRNDARAADQLIQELKREMDDERRIMDNDRRHLQEEIALARTERDHAQKQLHLERMEFVRAKEAWMLERKRAAVATAEERKEIAMERALLEAKKEAVAEMEVELERLKEREALTMARFLFLDRTVYESEAHALSYKVADLHREAATLRADRLALEAAKVKLVAETDAFQKAWEKAEKQHKECSLLKETAEQERLAAEKIYNEARSIIAGLENEKQEVEKCRQALEAEKTRMVLVKQALVDERILLAKDRTIVGVSSVHTSVEKSKPETAETSAPSERGPSAFGTRFLSAAGETSPSRRPLSPARGLTMPRAADVFRVEKSIQRAEVEIKLNNSLNRHISQLSENKEVLREQLAYLTSFKRDHGQQRWAVQRTCNV
ncbi:hypothetical protein HDV05_007336 [Chytridiales sp. JEL 0842]|nr:hypothetical protein HDV05_007336 [Chytridiales sp. JEL 0842]